MSVKEIIEKRRAYCELDPVGIDEQLINELATTASLAPSCMNNQPWRMVFIKEPEMLAQVHTALSSGNDWAKKGSMIIAVFGAKEFDCQIKGREYLLFDMGLATAFMILRATELGLVAHPIAGFNEETVKTTLAIPAEMTVITLIIVGKHLAEVKPEQAVNMISGEKNRPERLPPEKFAYYDRFTC